MVVVPAEVGTAPVDDRATVVDVVDGAGAAVVALDTAVVGLVKGAVAKVVGGSEVVVAGGNVVGAADVVTAAADVDVLALTGVVGTAVVATVLVVAWARGTSDGAGPAVAEGPVVPAPAGVFRRTGVLESELFSAVPLRWPPIDGER